MGVLLYKDHKIEGHVYMDRREFSEPTEEDLICFLGFTYHRKDFETEGGTKDRVTALLLRPVTADRYERVGCVPHLTNDPF